MSAPTVTWHDVVCSRVPHGAKAYHCDPAQATAELAWLRPCADAWTLWSNAAPESPPKLIGILARSSEGWSWSLGVACPASSDLADREAAIRSMQRAVEAAVDFLSP